ncbi:GNAT family N-acetyltransferase [Tardiphaga sp.]|uniref:GNAT family N-acetyltransferase n=1 Tax=Tardiphaga sp. TaxID=1926292 RepID=UPI00263498AD|nr:GNAT family N-acetyltransferase [Tardiphaga sp.]
MGRGASRADGERRDALPLLTTIAADAWRRLATRAIEPNGYYLPDWELAVNASATGRTGVSALAAWSASPSPRLIGLLPVISGWRAFRLPLPFLVSASPYGTLTTPLLERNDAPEALTALLDQARRAGAHTLLLRDMALDGAAMATLTAVLASRGLAPCLLQPRRRASLDATRDADEVLHDGLGAKKLKELRRQRHRLAEHGDVVFTVARSPAEVAAALEIFLVLEAGGWKGKRGTALSQDTGDAAFIRRAVPGLAEAAQCEIITLHAGRTPIAAGIVLRHLDRAFYFKIGIDERFAKFSPGVQLTLDLTRHLCADPGIRSADSTAAPGHPMIDPIWRGRLTISDVLIPLRSGHPAVAMIHAVLRLRQSAIDGLRRVAQKLRG